MTIQVFIRNDSRFCEYCLSDKAFIAGVMKKAMSGQFSKPAFSSSSNSTFNGIMNFVTAKNVSVHTVMFEIPY